MHATLFAAFLQAVYTVVKLDFEKLQAITVVNYRQFFTLPFSKDVIALLRTCIASSFPIDQMEDFTNLAKAIHHSVHSQLDEGKHVLAIKKLDERLERHISPHELWQRSKFPSNGITLTNLGSLDFSGEYSKLSLKELFFVANVEHFIEDSTNFILGAVTYRGKLSLSLWYIEELVEDTVGEAILDEMNKILMRIK